MIRTVAETGSTNADMLELAEAGEAEGLWLRAERQTNGRGRLGRDWISPCGNLYASTLVRLRSGDPAAATLGFVAAVALVDALSIVAAEVSLLIKWPNDVMVVEGTELSGGSAAKLSGILLERFGDAIVVGIGVNLAHAPELPDRPTTCLDSAGISIGPSEFLDVLAGCFSRKLATWREPGLGVIIEMWEARAHRPGTALKVALPDGVHIEGYYQGLSSDGALRLRLADGADRVIHAGDVFLV